MPINDMRTQACVHDVRVRLTDCLLQSRKDFGASTMSRRTGGVPAITVVRFRSSAVRTVKVWADEVKVCESQARGKAVERTHYAQDMPARAEIGRKLDYLQKCTCIAYKCMNLHILAISRLNFASLHFPGGRTYSHFT